MQKKSRIILIFPLLFVLLTLQAACAYWSGDHKLPPQEVFIEEQHKNKV